MSTPSGSLLRFEVGPYPPVRLWASHIRYACFAVRATYYVRSDEYREQCNAWKMPVGGGEETKVLDSVHCDGFWDVGEQRIYYVSKPDEKRRSEIRFYDFPTGKTRKILMLDLRNPYVTLAVSPDGRTIGYTQYDQVGSDLMLVENFR